MNILQILISGLAMSIVGGVMGMTFATINQSNIYPKAPIPCAAVGAIIGLAVGCGQEAVRELASEETD